MLGIYTQYNGDLVLDATVFASNIEFTTNEKGFWYLSATLTINREAAADLYKRRKVGHVFYGTGSEIFFEGRLEDVELSAEPKIVAYGYIRAFSDLQVTDLWSTQRYDLWSIYTKDMRTSVLDDAYTADNNNRLYMALNKNAENPTALTEFAGWWFLIPSKSTRPITAINYRNTIVNIPTTSLYTNIQRITEDLQQSNPNSNNLTSTVASGYTEYVNYFPLATSGIAYNFIPNFAGVYVGETGEVAAKITELRVGTTPSISGGRLYADEILKYTLSGVYTLNSFQINLDTSAIESPAHDLKEVLFEDLTGLDVVDFLLGYTDSSGYEWECKIWENQKVIFRRAKTVYKTWNIDISDFTLVRTLENTYNSYRGVYDKETTYRRVSGLPQFNRAPVDLREPPSETTVKSTRRTNYYTNTNSVDTYGITRQKSVKIITGTENQANLKMQAIANSAQSLQLKTEVPVTYVLDENGSKHDARIVRSGDRIVIQNIPAALLEEIENTFFVAETKYNAEEGIMYLSPEQPLDTLETIIGK